MIAMINITVLEAVIMVDVVETFRPMSDFASYKTGE